MTALILAGGGTGGHVYPLVAVAEALRKLVPNWRLVFVGTSRGIETRVVPAKGFELELVQVQPIRGGGIAGGVRGVVRAAMSLAESRQLLSRIQPAAVLTVGGYAAGPVSLVARLSGIPVGLLEPNAVMGLANRLMAPLVQRGYTAFAPAERHFSRGKVLRAGVPIRQGFTPSPLALAARPRRILVLGGSQGARSLNESVPLGLGKMTVPLEIRHQCGTSDVERVRGLYRDTRLSSAEVLAFIDDMPSAIAWADVVVSRSGASAVSEICAVGRPSLLVPYPYAAGNHQELNAKSLAADGAARWVADAALSADVIARELEWFFSEESRLVAMAQAASVCGRPDAARDVAVDLLRLAVARVPAKQRDEVFARIKEIV